MTFAWDTASLLPGTHTIRADAKKNGLTASAGETVTK